MKSNDKKRTSSSTTITATSTSVSSKRQQAVVPVGIDLGSHYARVAVVVSSSGGAVRQQPQPRLVSNTLGHRATRALAASEVSIQGQDGGQEAAAVADTSFVFGEAALRLLEKETARPSTVRDLIQSLSLSTNDDNDGNDIQKDDVLTLNSDSDSACQAFVGHLGSLASDATACSAQDLRVVLSVPMDASNDHVDTLKGVTEAGIQKRIAADNSNNNKQSRRKLRKQHVLVGVIYDAMAVCLAHDLMSLSDDDTPTAPTATRTAYSNILVIDAGASGLNVSHLTPTSKTCKILSLVSHYRLDELSGEALVTLMAQHVASQFERKHKASGIVPYPGAIWESKRARSKLLAACRGGLSSLYSSAASSSTATTAAGSNSIHITIDGLYEGMDCHVPLSKPRWNMISSPLMLKAQAFLTSIQQQQQNQGGFDVVLLAGSGWSFLESTVSQVFGSSPFRGVPPAKLAPEEAVALGCAKYAAAACAQEEQQRSSSSSTSTSSGTAKFLHHTTTPTLSGVVQSPVEIAMGRSAPQGQQGEQNDGDENIHMTTLIGKGTPLPAHVVHTFTPLQQQQQQQQQHDASNEELSIWQVLPSQKRVANLKELPKDEVVEVVVELTVQGKLSIAVQGGPITTL